MDRSPHELAGKRRTFNAIHFKMTHRLSWSQLPARYGSQAVLRQNFTSYQRSGLFVRLRDALKDNPDGADLVRWLGKVIPDRPARRGTASGTNSDQDSSDGNPENRTVA
ncbi:hypothetical protein ACGF5C_34430 [Micromonospora sp. NPDC047620]|uniref:hypothetical protein n=1 Tax=Micromonospora sp. NPDC047620 TaxID=3364251 RepID=UPI00371F1BD5